MATLEAQFAAAQNASLQKKVQMAILQAAENIASEAPSAPVSTYQKRQQLSALVLNNPQQMVPVFTYAVCAQDITDASTDAAILTMVASVWNGIAGVTS